MACVALERADPFAALLGSGRGRADLRALLLGLDDESAREGAQRLHAELAGGHVAQTLELLTQALGDSERLPGGALTRLAQELLRGAVERAYAEGSVREATRELLAEVKLRTHHAEHIVAERGKGSKPPTLHFCQVPVTERVPGVALTAACAKRLRPGSVVAAKRGDWRQGAALAVGVHCPGCEPQAQRFAEASEPAAFEPLSSAQERRVLAGAISFLNAHLARNLRRCAANPKRFERDVRHAYRVALAEDLASELHRTPGRSLARILSAADFDTLALASAQLDIDLTALLSLDDWREVLLTETYRAIPLSGSDAPAQASGTLGARLLEAALALVNRHH